MSVWGKKMYRWKVIVLMKVLIETKKLIIFHTHVFEEKY